LEAVSLVEFVESPDRVLLSVELAAPAGDPAVEVVAPKERQN
jgi:hypothetical protein